VAENEAAFPAIFAFRRAPDSQRQFEHAEERFSSTSASAGTP
jgi:hypothetical protein